MARPGQQMASSVSLARAKCAASNVAWIVLVLAVFHFLWDTAGKYGHLDSEAYTLFLSRREWLWAHLAGGIVTLLPGPFRFLTRLRAMHPRIHRWSGRIYLVAMIVGAFGATGLIATTSAPFAIRIEFAATELAWLFTALMGFNAIRAKRLLEHRRWMIRNYIVTCAFVAFRLTMLIPGVMVLGPPSVMIPLLLWSSWVLPLFACEVWHGASNRHDRRTLEGMGR